MSSKWHAGRIICALARHFDWFQNQMMTEYFVDGGIADLVFITRAGYLTEIEIKTSLADWNVDQVKAKWKKGRPHVSRFFYAIPEALADKVPAWVPAEVGIIVCFSPGPHSVDGCRVLREAARVRCKKIEDTKRQHINDRCYYRYWRLHLSLLNGRIYEQQTRNHRRAA